MILNKMLYITESEAKKIILSNEKQKTHLAIIDFINVKSWSDFVIVLGDIYQLPIRNEGYDGTRDWMEDLDWLPYGEYVAILYNLSSIQDKNLKENNLSLFKLVIQWWEKDVEQFCVGGKAKPFNVYLVN